MSGYDLIVLGAGSAGMSAAKQAAKEGASVAIVEARTVGGTCVGRGCMPKKFLALAGNKMRTMTASGPRGLPAPDPQPDWSGVIDHEQDVVGQLIASNRDGLLEYESIDLIEGEARFVDSRTLEINGTSLTGDRVVIATGLHPNRPSIDGIQHALDSDQFFRTRDWNRSVALIGGGYIGVEFASILTSFGAEVTVVQRSARIIKDHDRVAAEHLRDCLVDRGITIHTNTEVRALEPEGDRIHLVTDSNEVDPVVDEVIVAAGRQPNTDGLGVENTGVVLDEEGHIEVNDSLRTRDEAIYAAGDVLGHHEFTPIAIREGKAAGANACNGSGRTVNYHAIPVAVFTDPPLGGVGLTEAEARERFDSVEVAESSFASFETAVLGHDEKTLIRVLYAGDDNQFVGLHVVGPHAPELVQGFGPAIRLGATKEDIQNYPGIHPTVAEEVFSATVSP